MVARRGTVVVEVDLDLVGRATEMVGVDSICAAVAEVDDVVDAGTIFVGVADVAPAADDVDGGTRVTDAGAMATRGAGSGAAPALGDGGDGAPMDLSSECARCRGGEWLATGNLVKRSAKGMPGR